MDLNDEVCLCFHVTKRKVINYIKVNKPRRPSQLADCYGAGTGCGWCRKLLHHYFDQMQEVNDIEKITDPSSNEHQEKRAEYIAEGKGTPPSS